MSSEVRTRTTRDDAVAAARARFLAGERVDVSALAVELGLARMTLYRWFGDREALLGEVLCELFDETVARRSRRVRGRGADRLVALVDAVNRDISRSAPLAELLRREPECALRVLTSASSPVQQRAVDTWQRLLEQASAAGEARFLLDPSTLAQVLVRVGQSFLWPELLMGAAADPRRASDVYRALLAPPAS